MSANRQHFSIINIGTDLIEIGRIQKAYEKYKNTFLERVFTPEEITYCFSQKNPYPSLAARFAAKEAASKALSTGIGQYLNWKSISISKGSRNEPILVFDNQAQALLQNYGYFHASVSLSHTKTLAQAFVVIYG